MTRYGLVTGVWLERPPSPPPVGVVVGVPPSVGVAVGDVVGVVVSVGVAVGVVVAFCGCTKIWINVPFGSTWFAAGFWL